MITDFPKKKSYNLGGLQNFHFVHTSNVKQYPILVNGKISGELQLMPGADLLKGYATYYTLEFSENPKQSPNGVYYDQKVVGFCPGDHKELLDLISSMESNEFVLLVKDTRKQVRMLGGYGFPLEFLADYSSGAERSDAKGFSFSFAGVAPFRAPIYQV